MFFNETLQNHLETSTSIRSHSLVTAEWNMNVASNIKQIGNYRFRPLDPDDSLYKRVTPSFDARDDANFYTGATDADIIIDGGYTNDKNNPQPIAFISKKEKDAMLYSLEDCFGKFRPRSGINKLRFFEGKYTHHANQEMASRPRYYMGDRADQFKYWSSFRTESGKERGVAKNIFNNQYYIDDAVPYVVYDSPVPANRVVIKMQTNVGETNLGTFESLDGEFVDPFYGIANQTTPVRWRIQYLENNNWVDAISFGPDSTRSDGTSIIKSDGYVEVGYGLIIPVEYRQFFYFSGEYSSAAMLPDPLGLLDGTAYLVKQSELDPGVYHVVISGAYENFSAKYGWYLEESALSSTTNYVTNLTTPPMFSDSNGVVSGNREFKYINGLRVVVETMNVFDSSFDLIELSPRLLVDISDKVEALNLTKTASDLGVSGMPVGQLLASTGSLTIFDYDQAFFTENTSSIVSKYTAQNVKVDIYDVVLDVDGVDYFVPIKTLYSEGFPEVSSKDRSVTINLRDLFFHFEAITAPQILIKDASISSAISMLLDSVGFSNYVFRRNTNEAELIIPYFSVGPDKSLAEVLSEIAISAQAAMFFDEYNNFVVMSKNYIMPTIAERATDVTLYGSKDQAKLGILENSDTKPKLANVVDLASQESIVYNDGVINYTTSYIQKSFSSIKQASFVDRDKTWVYKPALLWEVTGDESTKSVNEEITQQSSYALGAIPLNADLSSTLPTVVNRKLVNNVMDLGDGVYWITRYNGYFYANGEIIKYDAVQFSIAGLVLEDNDTPNWTVGDGNTVWITSVQEYQRYFAKVPFNGKIYPTGLVRIYAEPQYEVIDGKTLLKNGLAHKHGRGQFGTPVVEHPAGLSSYWYNDENLRGVTMDNKYLFSTNLETELSNVYSDPIYRGIASINSNFGVSVAAKIYVKSTTDSTAVIKSVSHGLSIGEIIHFTTTINLPDGIEEGIVYYVKELVSDDEFTVSASSGGSAVTMSGTQSGTHSWTVLVDKAFPGTPNFATTLTIADPAVFTNSSPAEQDIIFFTTTGVLPTGLQAMKLYSVVSKPTETTFTIAELGKLDTIATTGVQSGVHTVHVLTNVSYVQASQHKLVAGDEVYFVSLPEDDQFEPTDIYTVSSTGLSSSRFLILDSSGDRVSVDGMLDTEYILNANFTVEESKSRIILPTLENVEVGFTVEFVDGVGELAEGTKITAVDQEHKSITISPAATQLLLNENPLTAEKVITSIKIIDKIEAASGQAGLANNEAKSTTRNSIIKNFLSAAYVEEETANRMYTTETGTIQSSALVMNGSVANNTSERPKLLSYVYKNLENRFTHFGTRMRIIGEIDNNEFRGQSPYGVSTYYTAEAKTSDKSVSIGGSSGGLAVLLNPETNNGYYFEIMALTESSFGRYENGGSIHNVVFYKLKKNASSTVPEDDAVPVKLWGGNANIIVDDGLFTGQQRMAAQDNSTVYDLGVEYERVGKSLRFYLYINNELVGVVDDDNPATIDGNIDIRNNMAMFVRGSSRVMFENVYALANNYSKDTMGDVGRVNAGGFGNLNLNTSNSFQKYALSGVLQQTYLSGISSSDANSYQIYFDEFGTIMREMAYFNVRYDKAYPALYAKIAKTFNRVQGYVVSGFTSGAYGAEFLIFNATDKALNLDATSGNYLRILGVTFTQQSTHELTVDEYFSKVSDASNPQFLADSTVRSPLKEQKAYNDIKFSRLTHGKRQFSLTAPYIQSQDQANDLMEWMISKIMTPRKSVGVNVFGLSTIQLGDIVEIDYINENGVNEVSPNNSRFVVYGIEYSRDESGPDMSIYLSEVI